MPQSIRVHTLLPLVIGSLVLMLFGLTAYAQNLPERASPLSDYFIETWTSRDGLPHNSINAIAQTDDGYLWFATWEGVARYNGLDFTLYTRSETSQMKDSGTKSLTALSKNRLLVAGARGSLTERMGYTWQGHESAGNLINHALPDQEGNLWLAIEGRGVQVRTRQSDGSYNPGVWKLRHSSYRLLAAGEQIYAATEQGLFRLNANREAEHLPHSGFQRVFYISQHRNGSLLLATDRGAWQWQPEIGFSSLTNELSDRTITLVEEDNEGNVWLGTINKGIARLSPHTDQQGTLEFLDDSQGLPNNRVWSWYQDRENSIWVGTNGGVIRLRNAPFISLTEQQGLIGNYVRTLLQVADQKLLVGTSNGLGLIDQGQPQSAVTDESVKNHRNLSVLSLAPHPEGGAWIGTYQQGLLHWQPHPSSYYPGKLTQVWDEDSNLPSNEIRAILNDRQGNLWLGTPNGLVLRQPSGKVQHFTKDNSPLPGNFVMALAEDETGKIWVGTGVGVVYLHQEKWHSLPLPEHEGAQYAFGFYIEPGYVWLATDRGIARFRQSDQHLALIGRPQGLPNDKFFQILPDNKGHFWLTSNRGIWRIQQEDAHGLLDGRLQTIRFEHFSEGDGMASSQANGGSNPTAVRTDQGTLYFATAKGVTHLQPERLERGREHTIPVVLESVRFDSKLINPEVRNKLPANINRIQLDYVGLSFVMSDRLEYRTRLEGFDENWAYRAQSNRAEYTNLPPGHYRFQASVRYPYGPWHDAGVLYEFEVLPGFWQRTDVQIISALILLGVIAGLIHWRIRSLKLSAIRLEHKVAEQTSELRQQAEAFEKLSRQDSLTGLANRRAFDQMLEQRFRQSQQKKMPLVIAIIDIDHFKRVNDHYSHLVGDQAIKAVAKALSEHCSQEGVARWGGEEFTALFEGTMSDAYSHFDQLRQTLADTDFSYLAPGLTITISIGLAENTEYDNYESQLIAADHALLAAKQNGRNRVEQSSPQSD